MVSSELRLEKVSLPADDPSAANLVILDCSDAGAALDFVRRLHDEHPQLPVLVLLPKVENSHIYPLLRLGVKGMLTYSQAQRELARIAAQVAVGGYCVPHELLIGFVESILPELHRSKSLVAEVEISRREREVLNLLLENLSNKEIAAKLFVSERTVKFHVSNLLSKFGVQRRAELIVLWMRQAASLPWPSHDSHPLCTRIN
jgi:DNA-binding NarL/FixJ family response regulator